MRTRKARARARVYAYIEVNEMDLGVDGSIEEDRPDGTRERQEEGKKAKTGLTYGRRTKCRQDRAEKKTRAQEGRENNHEVEALQ